MNHPIRIPANPKASPITRRLFTWLSSLADRTERKMLIGQFCGYPNPQPQLLAQTHPTSTFTPRYMEEIHALTGRHPALMGVDYYGNTGGIDDGPDIVTTEHSHLRTLNHSDATGTAVHLNRELIAWWNAGGLVTISIHCYRPDTHQPNHSGGMMKFGFGNSDRFPADERFREYDLRRILPGGADRVNWEAMMDGMAAGLTELRNAGVVVIWRPFHEVDKGWWWGKHDPALFGQVWRDMFRRFSDQHRLDNLLWAYTGDPHQYPGDDLVDLVGNDNYNRQLTDRSLHDWTVQRGKLHAQTEFGFGIDALRDNSTASYDFAELTASLRPWRPRSVYLLVWSDAWRIGNPRHLHQRELMEDPWIISREDMEQSWRTGT
ncbi:MAG: glycosyl hydrolase [Planctomycetota bacterium]|jgi:mannan endo-1,4-beta-mannosidase|nr:glycosyl hydrolase [Planctomycetota bacterium]